MLLDEPKVIAFPEPSTQGFVRTSQLQSYTRVNPAGSLEEAALTSRLAFPEMTPLALFRAIMRSGYTTVMVMVLDPVTPVVLSVEVTLNT
jgi:hypothetical protein